jgi:hypothetical protein
MPHEKAPKSAPISAPRGQADRPGDEVERDSDNSFPASDAPSWTPVTRVGEPRILPERRMSSR